MLASTLFTLLTAGLVSAVPLNRRDVTIDQAATAEAQVRDNTATRAFSATTIQTSSGQCLSVDPASGDFRENLTPVVSVECNGSANQTWDVITSGVHNNVPGQALIVSSLTQACLNFDPRRAAGNQVLLFSCGGRADGSGQVTNSQLFPFAGGAGPLPLLPQNGNNATCLTINANNALDQTACTPASASGSELFTFGGAASLGSGASSSTSSVATATAATSEVSTTTATEDCAASTITVTVTVSATDAVATTNVAVVETTSSAVLAATTTTATATATIAVAGAGGVLNPSAVAEAQVKDLTATRAATGAQIKTSDGQCLSVNATAGDFRENLIPINVKACDSNDVGQQFDFITAGVHNNQPGQTLIVSSLTQGCFNFDPRRASGDQVILFSCGGRADGSGQVTNSQLFPFTAANLTEPYALTPSNAQGVCFINDNGRLSNTDCDTVKPTADELFTIVV